MSAVAKAAQLAEDRFARLLEQRGYAYRRETELEQEIAVRGARPDFCVRINPQTLLLAEVKSFNRPPLALGSGPFVQFPLEPLLKPLRCAVEEAGKQLKAYRADGFATIVILDGASARGVPINVEYLRDALFGNPERRIEADGKTIGPWEPHRGRGQLFHISRKRYISAVAWNLSKPLNRENTRLRVVHNPFSTVPLPLDVFRDKEDEHWGYEGDGRWVRFGVIGNPAIV
ncbi:MAG: hypothetical protein KGL75_04490 [Acidobacteriota bacterium]|nr:hypothetical protein [Acidobacteriota bacterium]